MTILRIIFFLLIITATEFAKSEIDVDENGYLFFCLCMGRFGNQMEHFLGGLSFAKTINRTLIIPPLRTYKNVEYDEWFKSDLLSGYHRVILAKDFMQNLAPTVWPERKRFAFCFQHSTHGVLCEVKQGNPFKNFWDELGVEFSDTMRHSISYQFPQKWNSDYPPSDFPVIALKGAPASFPMQKEDAQIQKYIEFSDKIKTEAEELLVKHFGEITCDYVAIHLRNGPDWSKACEIFDSPGTTKFMANYQCNNWDYSKATTKEMCFPPTETIMKLTQRIMKEEKCNKLLIATDKETLIDSFREMLGNDVKIAHPDPWLPVVDIYLLSHSKHFIGNCVSSFSSFVYRQRLHHNLGKSSYPGID